MSMQKIYKIRDALSTVSENVEHYEASNKSDKYIVWAEDMESDSLNTDNKKSIQVIQGTIDYFTKTEGDETVDKIQNALDNAKIPYSLSSVQYEDETNYIHYEWVWEVS